MLSLSKRVMFFVALVWLFLLCHALSNRVDGAATSAPRTYRLQAHARSPHLAAFSHDRDSSRSILSPHARRIRELMLRKRGHSLRDATSPRHRPTSPVDVYERFARPKSTRASLPTLADSVIQSWSAQYSSGTVPSDDEAMDIAVDAAGNIYVTGFSTRSLNGADYLTIKYDPSGNVVWTARYDNGWDDIAFSVAVDGAENVYVTGASWTPATGSDYLTVKYNSAGVQQWIARYNGPGNSEDWARDVAVDSVENVYVTGSSEGVTTSWDYATIKYNASGTQQWASRYNGPVGANDMAIAIALDGLGNSYVTGGSEGDLTLTDFATIRYNSNGAQQWVARYDGTASGDDATIGIGIDSLSNIYVAGMSEGTGTSIDYATLKYTSVGTLSWARRYNGAANGADIPSAIAVDRAGNVSVTGGSEGTTTLTDYATVRYTSAGVQRWAVRYNGSGNDEDAATAVASDNSGNVYVTGWSVGIDGTADFITIKYGSTGSQQWAVGFNGPGADWDYPRAVTIERNGNILVTGYSVSAQSSSDYATAKYSSASAEQWRRFYDGPGIAQDEATAVMMDASGNAYVTGFSYNPEGTTDFVTVKYNTLGQQQWAVRYNGPANSDDIPLALGVDAAGNVYVTGVSDGLTTYWDFQTLKYDGTGALLWAVRYNGPDNYDDVPSAIAIDASGNAFVTGGSWGTGGSLDFTTIKYNSAGAQQWIASYNGNANDEDMANDIAMDRSGNSYVVGRSWGGATANDFVTIKYSPVGVEQWVVRYNAAVNGDDNANSVAVDGVGNVYVTGDSWGFGTGLDVLTMKYNSEGIEQWVNRYNGPDGGDEAGTDVLVAPSPAGYSVVVVGTCVGLSTGADFLTLKYDTSGSLLWTRRYDGVEQADEIAVASCTDEMGNIFVTGTTSDGSTFADIATVKYTSGGIQGWVARYDGPGNTEEVAAAIALDQRGNVVVAGTSRLESASAYVTIGYREGSPGFLPSRWSMSFGETNLHCRRTDTLLVRNPRAQSLSVASVSSSSSLFSCSPASVTVPPFDSVRFFISFVPTSVGPKSASLLFASNAATSPDTIALNGFGSVPPGGILIDPRYDLGWQLISLPLNPPCRVYIPGIFRYVVGTGYQRRDTLQRREGCWWKVPVSSFQYAGNPVARDTLPVTAGWNIIGSISYLVDTATIVYVPSTLRASNYYGHSMGYFAEDSLEPGRAYWFKAHSSGSLILSLTGTARQSAARENPLNEFSTLTITDASGASQTLYVGTEGGPLIDLEQYELPPPGPEGVFDARFESQRMVDMLGSDGETAIAIRSTAYPVRVSWKMKSETACGVCLKDGIDGRLVPAFELSGEGELVITNAAVNRILLTAQIEQLPKEFSLSQNYPNPFNPVTSIRYALPVKSVVKLELFNILGQRVQTLVNEERPAGYHLVQWNGVDESGNSLGSGVYFVRISARGENGTEFNHVRKLMMMK